MYRRWLKQRFKKPAGLQCGLALLLMVLSAVACNAEPIATPVPTTVQARLPTATSEPTAVPESTAEPTTESTATPKDGAMAFDDYWNPPTDYYGEPVYGGTLRINYQDPLEHANAWSAAYGVTDMYRVPTGATLVMENPYDAYAPVVPDLAKGWEIHDSLDGVTFHFREGTTWHNGEPFVCEDARFSFETMITEEGITASYMQSRLAQVVVDEMTCLDDMTLEINFSGPTAIPLHSLSNRRALVFNKAWFQAGGEEAMFEDVTMGIGPYKWAEGQRVGVDEQRFERNPDYFIEKLPYVDELVIFGILDYSARQAAQLAHQTDWVWVWTSDWGGIWYPQYQAYVDHDQIVTVIGATRGNLRLWINARRPPLDNRKVRQAIVMGIDRNAFIQKLQDGHGAVGGFGYAPGSPWEPPKEQLCSVPGWCVSEDMEATRAEARAILEEEGFDFERTYVVTVSSDDEKYFVPAALLQAQLRLLGVKTDFDTPRDWRRPPLPVDYSWDDFRLTNTTVTADDPNAGVAAYLRCDSYFNYWTPDGPCDENIVALLDQAQVESDATKRLALAHQIELAAMQQYSSFPVYWEQEAAAFWPEVRGYVHFPARFGSFSKFMHLWIDPARKNDTGYAGQTRGVPGGFLHLWFG